MKWILPAVFMVVLIGQFFHVTGLPAAPSEGVWVTYELDIPEESRLDRYFGSGEHWLGLSYALAGTFAVWCFSRFITLRRETLAASASGLTLSGALWAGGCFMTGCCGSPMLPIYLGLFGPQFVQVTKPLTLAITLISIGLGYAWMLKRTPRRISRNVNTGIHAVVGADTGQVRPGNADLDARAD